MKVVQKAEFPDERFNGLCYLRVGGSNDYITAEYDKLNGIGITKGIKYATPYTKVVAKLIAKLINVDVEIEDFKG